MFKFLRKLNKKESKSLEDCLAQNGLEFDSQESAEKYFFDKRDKDIEKLDLLNSTHPELDLNKRALSLKRIEAFYYKNFIDARNNIGITKDEMEELMTQYVRQVFVANEMAEWMVFENDFAEGRYDLGLMYGYGSGTMENYARGLGNIESNKSRMYLYDKFMMYVPTEREEEVQ